MKIEMKEIEYLGNPDDLKTRIAKMCVDMTGSMENKTVLVRVLRGHSLSLEYYQNGSDGYNNHDRFWWEFPMFFYKDMPSGYFVRETSDGNYYLVDENEKFLQEIDISDIMSELVDDLVERNYEDFNDNWDEFIVEFQKWIVEVD